MEFCKILVNNKDELLTHKNNIFDLFRSCFYRNIDDKLWNWAYMDNPNGEPIVSLFYDNNKLVGHYAVIPTNFIYKNKTLKAVLSMTTMVDAAYRKYGIFVEQASFVYEKAFDLNYKFIYGFPNQKSAPGFKKRLGWTIENLYVASFDYDELQKIDKKTYLNTIFFDTQNKENLNWRLNKPNQNYFKKNNNIIKEFNGALDIVFNSFDFSNLARDRKYNLLLDFNFERYLDFKQFDYMFGYKLFDQSLAGVEFKKDLLMSDVF
ncbi:Uncharacterised protein [Campylobacter hyointestinalis]|uniref:GNAT family N-acetyltransferase n=1 Tax=Campylobacter hyointestinalis TaxID=198 RepID=UPI00072A769F|nr:GNAT family N-acetyltransferase [Campylobacter hyointestinalis]PPB51475.1 hypothetical protein CDQ67_10145 [Campylobacter hyointestinalis subsp. hyointestinalis]CUU89401.1 Uncharacterised protein [Campylobacter hyointestinalis]